MKNLFGLAIRYTKQNIHRTITTMIGIMLSTVIIYMIFTAGYSGYDSIMEEKYRESMGWDAVYTCDLDTAEDILTLAPYYNQTPVIDNSEFKVSHSFYLMIDSVYHMTYINDFNAMPVKFELLYCSDTETKEDWIISREYARWEKLALNDTYIYTYVDYSVEREERIDYTCENNICGIYKNTSYEIDFSLNPTPFVAENGNYRLINDEAINNIEYLQVYVTFESKDNIVNQAKALAKAFGIQQYLINKCAIEAFMTHNDNDSVNFLGLEAALLILAALGAICAMFIVRNAFNISVHERNNDYGILRCIGMNRKQIIKIILTEALIIALAGITLGIILGHGLSFVAFSFIRKMLAYSSTFRVRFYLKALILTVIYALVTTCYAMVSPIEKLYKLNPIESLNHKEEFKIKKNKPKRGKLLTKIFGFEVGYAYKTVLRRKGRFVITLATLIIGTFLFITLSTTYLSVYNWIKKDVLGENIYDGCFYISEYEDAKIIEEDLKEFNLIESSSVYNLVEIGFYSEDNWENEKEDNFLGVDSNIYSSMVEKATMVSPSEKENVINVLVTDNYTKYDLGDTYTVKCDEDEYTFFIYGIIPEVYYSDITFSYGIFSKNEEESMKVPRMIYELGGDFDGITTIPEGYNSRSSDYCMRIDLKENINTSSLDDYINKVPYVYDDNLSVANTIYSTIKAYKYIITAFILIVLIMYLTNVINVNRADVLIRKKEFEIMRHIGMSKKQQGVILLSESLISSIIALIFGSILGTIGGYFLSLIMLIDVKKPEFIIDWISIIICGVVLILFSIITTGLLKNKE